MARIPIKVPKVSSAAVEATLAEFVVASGDEVQAGETLYVVATDKVETEIPAAASGVVQWDAELEKTYDVGQEIGHIETSDS